MNDKLSYSMNWYDNFNWTTFINDPYYPRYGVSIRHVVSGNDGDVCLAYITEILLKNMAALLL